MAKINSAVETALRVQDVDRLLSSDGSPEVDLDMTLAPNDALDVVGGNDLTHDGHSNVYSMP